MLSAGEADFCRKWCCWMADGDLSQSPSPLFDERGESRLQWKKTRAGIGNMFHKETLKDFQSTLKSRTSAARSFPAPDEWPRVFSHRRGNIAADVLDLRISTKCLTLGNLSLSLSLSLVDGVTSENLLLLPVKAWKNELKDVGN